MLQSMNADARVQFPDDYAPVDETLARAIISLADALAKGDADAMESLVNASARSVLDELTAFGDWYEAADTIEAVRVVFVEQAALEDDVDIANVAFAIQDADGAYILGWTADHLSSGWVFGNSVTTSDVKRRATDWDGTVQEELFPPITGVLTFKRPEDFIAGLKPGIDQAPTQGQRRDTNRKNTPAGPIEIPGG